MLRPLQLLLPALIPSWNFFDVIAASPRIEYALSDLPTEPQLSWTAFRPRPQTVSLPTMLKRLVWNPRWNETLFAVSCAERLMDYPTQHSEDELFRRIAADLARAPHAGALAPWVRFRLVFVSRDGEALQSEVRYQSEPRRRADIDVR